MKREINATVYLVVSRSFHYSPFLQTTHPLNWIEFVVEQHLLERSKQSMVAWHDCLSLSSAPACNLLREIGSIGVCSNLVWHNRPYLLLFLIPLFYLTLDPPKKEGSSKPVSLCLRQTYLIFSSHGFRLLHSLHASGVIY